MLNQKEAEKLHRKSIVVGFKNLSDEEKASMKEFAETRKAEADKLNTIEIVEYLNTHDEATDAIAQRLIEEAPEEFDDIIFKLNTNALITVASTMKGAVDSANEIIRETREKLRERE